MCDLQVAQSRLRRALRRLYERDRFLIETSVNERSITHWMAVYMQEAFPGWDVDCEYNKNGANPKRLPVAPWEITTADTNGQTVYPDIIVHHRGTQENLLVIEAKKGWTGANSANDVRKLQAFGELEEFAYRFGAFVVLNRRRVDIRWFSDGREHEPETLEMPPAKGAVV